MRRGVLTIRLERLVAVLRRGDVLPPGGRRAGAGPTVRPSPTARSLCASSPRSVPACATSSSTAPAPPACSWAGWPWSRCRRGPSSTASPCRSSAGVLPRRPAAVRRPHAAGDVRPVAAARSAAGDPELLTFVVLAVVQIEIAWMIPADRRSPVPPARLHARHLRQRLHPGRPPPVDGGPGRRLRARPGRAAVLTPTGRCAPMTSGRRRLHGHRVGDRRRWPTCAATRLNTAS